MPPRRRRRRPFRRGLRRPSAAAGGRTPCSLLVAARAESPGSGRVVPTATHKQWRAKRPRTPSPPLPPPPLSSPSPTPSLPSASASASARHGDLLRRRRRQPSRCSSPRYISPAFLFFFLLLLLLLLWAYPTTYLPGYFDARFGRFLVELQESPVAAGELEPVVIDDSLSIYKVRLQKCLHCVCGNASVAAARLCSATDSIRLLIVI